jgi:hypothetical protein
MKTTWNRWMEDRKNRAAGNPAVWGAAVRKRLLPPLTLPRLALAASGALLLALGLSSCENVAASNVLGLVRVIDASYIAQIDYPEGLNFYVENIGIATNVGEGYISGYGTMPISNAAGVKVTTSVGSTTLVATTVSLTKVTVGNQFSIFLTDNGASPASYTVTALQDQSVPAATGHSAFRFINQAPRTGALDIYMVPAGSTLSNTIPLYTNLTVGASTGYISFASQSVTMVITPTGTILPKYTSAGIALTGGEVRTVMMVDSQLTTDPPVSVVIANDVD